MNPTPGPAGPPDTAPAGQPTAFTAFAEERRTRILRLLAERGRVRTGELAALLDVTEATVRKDVADLARRGLLHRTHGGAMRPPPMPEPDLSDRAGRNTEAKTRIARTALGLIHDGDAVYLDAGSTVLRLAELLAEPEPGPDPARPPRILNVLTNAFGVARAVAERPGIRHTVLGGTYRPTGDCLVGPQALADLDGFTLTTAFIGVTGVTEQGFTAADLGEARLKATAIDHARRTVVLMDHHKAGTADFARICSLQAVHILITDTATDHLRDLCAAAGVELLIPDHPTA